MPMPCGRSSLRRPRVHRAQLSRRLLGQGVPVLREGSAEVLPEQCELSVAGFLHTDVRFEVVPYLRGVQEKRLGQRVV